MKIPLVDIQQQHRSIRRNLEKAIHGVFDSNQFIFGKDVERFESEAADFLKCRYAVGVASGTDALFLSLVALGIRAGDEVITTPHTYFATVGAILHAGARPVFVDIDPLSYALDPSLIRQKISWKTKAILPVHLYGQCADMKEIAKIAREHRLTVIEDCAQAFGAMQSGRYAGTFGDLGAFSAYPTKNLGACGDGGFITVEKKNLVERIRTLRVQGSRKGHKYVHDVMGYNSRLDSLQAAILRVKLKHIARWNQQRREKAEIYHRLLNGIPQIQTPWTIPGNVHVYHLYVIRAQQRDRLRAFLKKKGIETGVYYPLPQHLQKAVGGYKKGDIPEAEKAAEETVTLPMFPELTRQQQTFIVSGIQKFYE